MRQFTIFLNNGEIVHIDCIQEMRRKSLVFASAAKTWQGARPNEAGVKVADIADDLRYTRLFYLLNGVSVPYHYREHYLNQDEAKQLSLQTMIHQEFGMKERSLSSLLHYDKKLHNQSKAVLSGHSINQGFKGVYRKLLYFMDKLRTLVPQPGFIITFSGVDGAGKSTVIDATKHRIDKELRLPVVVLRHRPCLLPILSALKYGKQEAERQTTLRLPRQGQNRSLLSSYLRFAYYYTDYLIGQCYVYCRYVMRGYVVLYDRYYFDFINDSKRSNIMLPARITAWWYRFLLKPDLNFFLYAPTKVILERKQELNAESIEQLTGQYLKLFRELENKAAHSHYISISNINLNETLDTLFNHIKSRQVSHAA